MTWRAAIEDVDEWDVCNFHVDLLFRDICNGIDDHNILDFRYCHNESETI
jgi:hypothetical protein